MAQVVPIARRNLPLPCDQIILNVLPRLYAQTLRILEQLDVVVTSLIELAMTWLQRPPTT